MDSHIYANPAWKPLDGLGQGGGREHSQHGGGAGSFLRVKLSEATLHEALQALPFGISGFPSMK